MGKTSSYRLHYKNWHVFHLQEDMLGYRVVTHVD